MTRIRKSAHEQVRGAGVFARRGRGCPVSTRTACSALAAVITLSCATPPASGSGDLCYSALHAGYVEYELVDVEHEMDDGEFLGFCVNKEYGVFDVFVDAGPGGELALEIPGAMLDPRQFGGQVCDFGYSVNGSDYKHEGVHADLIRSTDRSITVEFQWDTHVSQISYVKSPAACLEQRDVLDHMWDTPLSTIRGLWYGEYHASIDAHCASPWANVIHLNHTVSGGTLDRVCSTYEREIVFDISPEIFGELIVDIPHDVFPPHTGAFEFHPVTGEPVDATYHRYPFTITTWNKYGIPYSTM